MSRFIWGTGENSSKSRPTSRNSIKTAKGDVNNPSDPLANLSRSLSPVTDPASASSAVAAALASTTSSSTSSVDVIPSPCHSCNSSNCCNNNWPIRDLPADIRPGGSLGPFTWCGLTVYVAVAGQQHEAPEITEYRQNYLNERLQELLLTLDIKFGEPEKAEVPVEVPAFRDVPQPLLPPPDEKPIEILDVLPPTSTIAIQDKPFFEDVFKDVAIPDRQFTAKELSTHNTKDDLYLALNDKVLDVTTWQDQHPGGGDILLDHGGKDASAEFQKRHESHVLKSYIPGAVIGTLIPDPEPTEHAHGHSVLSGVSCECDNCLALRTPPAPPPPPPPRVPTPDLSQPENPLVAAEVTALLAQLQSLLGAQAGMTLSSMIPKLAVTYTCEDAEDGEEEGIVMEMVVKYKAKRGGNGQHPMCVQARAGLGIDGVCGGCKPPTPAAVTPSEVL